MSVLKLIGDIARPATLKGLRDAGMFERRSPLAVAISLPWVLGRGVSIGLLSQMHAFVLGDKTALIDRQGELTWRQLDRRTNQASRLLANKGLRGGDRVALLLRNTRHMAELLLAAQKTGLAACPLNTWAKPAELEATIERAAPKLIVYDPRQREQLEQVALDGVPTLDLDSYTELRKQQSEAPPFPFTTRRGSPQVIIHTSGTSGKPKGAARSAASTGLGAMAELFSVVPYQRSDVIYCPAPMFHSFGLATFTFSTVLGATIVLSDRFDAEDALRSIENHRATAASFVPVMLRRILALPREVRSRYDLTSLRIVLVSGSALSDELRAQAVEVFGPVLYDLYGSTEVGWVAIATPEDIRSHPGSVGKPMPGLRLVVTDGRLMVKTDLAFEGYTTGEVMPGRDGYMEIGDAGHIDADGYIYVEGRADDMVVVGGENVYPAEIEAIIEGIDGVVEASVFGVEDYEFGHVLAACVEGVVSAGEVDAVCRRDLASYKVPRYIHVMESMPRTGSGKVIKRELRAFIRGGFA